MESNCQAMLSLVDTLVINDSLIDRIFNKNNVPLPTLLFIHIGYRRSPTTRTKHKYIQGCDS